MSNELTKTDAAPAFGMASMWASLEAMARDPDVDPAKMGSLVDIQERMIKTEAERRYTMAKHAAMRDLPAVRKDKRIVHPGKDGKPDRVVGKYRDFDSLMAICIPTLRENGLEVSFDPGVDDATKFPTVSCVVSWTDGELSYVEKGGPMAMPLDTTGSKSGPQGSASSLSYGKRHTFVASFNVVYEPDQDNDGNVQELVPRLSQSAEKILATAKAAAAKGTAGYKAWWDKQDMQTRGWMVDQGHHMRLQSDAEGAD